MALRQYRRRRLFPWGRKLRRYNFDVVKPAEVYDPSKGERPTGRPNSLYVYPMNLGGYKRKKKMKNGLGYVKMKKGLGYVMVPRQGKPGVGYVEYGQPKLGYVRMIPDQIQPNNFGYVDLKKKNLGYVSLPVAKPVMSVQPSVGYVQYGQPKLGYVKMDQGLGSCCASCADHGPCEGKQSLGGCCPGLMGFDNMGGMKKVAVMGALAAAVFFGARHFMNKKEEKSLPAPF